MNELGTAILTAMRDQGWLVVITDELVVTISPEQHVRTVPILLYYEPDETRLRIVLLAYVVADGLWWPWPPDHREDVHGEQPIGE